MKLHIRDIKHLFIKSNDLPEDLLFDSSNINTDSRTFKGNEIFLALEGEKFDGNNWYWCPKHADTDREFECHKAITPERVFETIEEWLI